MVVSYGPAEGEEEEGAEILVRDFWRDAYPFVPVTSHQLIHGGFPTPPFPLPSPPLQRGIRSSYQQ